MLSAASAAIGRAARAQPIGASPLGSGAVYRTMGYLLALVLLLIAVPIVILLASRRTTSAGGIAAKSRDRGVTLAGPSSDQPTPRSDATNQPAPGAERRLPPG